MLAHRRMLELDDMLRLGSQPLDTPAELAPVETDGAPSQPPTVLVVDDDRAVREVLSAVLKEEGYPVRQAAGADAALEMLRGDDLPLVLCDMKMPESGSSTTCCSAIPMPPSSCSRASATPRARSNA